MSWALNYLVKSAMEKQAKKWIWRLLPLLEKMNPAQRQKVYDRLSAFKYSRNKATALPVAQHRKLFPTPVKPTDLYGNFRRAQAFNETARTLLQEKSIAQALIRRMYDKHGVPITAREAANLSQNALKRGLGGRRGHGAKKKVGRSAGGLTFRSSTLFKLPEKYHQVALPPRYEKKLQKQLFLIKERDRVAKQVQAASGVLQQQYMPSGYSNLYRPSRGKPVPISTLKTNPAKQVYRGAGLNATLGITNVFASGYPQVAAKYGVQPTGLSIGAGETQYIYKIKKPPKAFYTPHVRKVEEGERRQLLQAAEVRRRRGGKVRSFGRSEIGDLPHYETVLQDPLTPKDFSGVYRLPKTRMDLWHLSNTPKKFMRRVSTMKVQPMVLKKLKPGELEGRTAEMGKWMQPLPLGKSKYKAR